MGGDSSFFAMLRIAGFLTAIWTATKISQNLKVSSIVLEITTGVVLGPDLVGLISPEYSQCEHSKYRECGDPEDSQYMASLVSMTDAELKLHHPSIVAEHVLEVCHRSDYHHEEAHGTDGSSSSADAGNSDGHAADGHHRRLAGGGSYHNYEECLVRTCVKELSGQCQRTPDVFTLIGHLGVALMIFESGMHFDFEKARSVGPWACLVAVLGTLLPLGCGTALSMAYGNSFMPDGLVAGTALAPTSVGMSLKLLTETKMLDKDFGQSIMTAAFVDDILSLILFNIIFSMGGGSVDFMHTFFPAIMGIAFMLFAVMLAVFLWPRLLKDFMAPAVRRFAREPNPKVPIEDEAILFVMLALLTSYAVITFFCGTHLWGCFIAGMSFACLGHDVFDAHHTWEKQTKRITSWMLRIFFSCTVAFSIPVSELMSFDAFWKGSIMGIGPCIATKVFCAFFMGRSRWVIGWAMVGRAEFAYLIAQMGLAGGMMDQKLFSIVIWALLWATVFAPLVFTRVLKQFIKHNSSDLSPAVSQRPAARDIGPAARDIEESAADPQLGPDQVTLDQVQLDFEVPNLLTGGPTPEAGRSKLGAGASEGHASEVAPPEGKQYAAAPEKQQAASRHHERLALQPTPRGKRGFSCCVFFKNAVTVPVP
jgi:Kef-type K+ transport system membrane component KefB